MGAWEPEVGGWKSGVGGEGWERRGGRAEGRRLLQNASSELSCKEALHVQPFSCPGYLKTPRNPHSPRRPPPPPLPVGRSVVPSGLPSCLSEVSPPPPRPAPQAAVPLKARRSGAAPLSKRTREERQRGEPPGMAMASPAIGQRPYRLLLEPEPPHYLQSLSDPEPLPPPPPPPPPGHSSRRCAPAPLSTAPGAHERRSAGRAARGDPEPQPRASRPARPLRPGLQQRLRRRPGAPRPRDVRSIFEQPQDPRVPAERGEGHCFVELALRGGRGWCDLCGREVWWRALSCASKCEGRGRAGLGRAGRPQSARERLRASRLGRAERGR